MNGALQPIQEALSYPLEPKIVNLELPALWGRCGEMNSQHGFILDGANTSVCAAGTKSGKTHGCASWIIQQAFRKRGRWGWAGPIYRQAQIGYDKVLRLIPEPLRIASDSALRIRLLNGSIIEFRSCEDPDNLFGFEYEGAVVDEASRIRDRAWDAIQTWTHRSKGPMKIIANQRGRRNWFFREWDRAMRGTPGMSGHHLRSSQNPFISPEVIQQAKDRLPDRIFRELYEAEVFDDQASPFSNWPACVDTEIKATPEAGKPYLGGVDFGRHQNYTVAIIGDKNGKAINMARWISLPWHATRARLKRLDRAYGGVDWLVDASGVGDSVAEDLDRDDGLRIEEFVFSEKSKAGLVGDLINDVEAEAISFPEWPQLAHELEVIEATRLKSGLWSYRAPEGDHDDIVMALALYSRKRRGGGSRRAEDYLIV